MNELSPNFNICGVVILYHPGDYIIDNISSYLSGLERLYVFDNSERYNRKLIEEIKRMEGVDYISNDGNMGIAYTLNAAIKKAKSEGYNWILTMDQDSSFKEGDFSKFRSWLDEHDTSEVGILSPLHSIEEFETKEYLHFTTMTSGNLLNISVYDRVGPFDEKLFIDEVDAEYCLRLNMNGYKIIRFYDIILVHALGELKIVDFKIKKIWASNHNPVRRYYITRNRLYVWTKYFKFYPKLSIRILYHTCVEMLKIILVEDQKWSKFKYISRAIKDYLFRNYGKLSN